MYLAPNKKVIKCFFVFLGFFVLFFVLFCFPELKGMNYTWHEKLRMKEGGPSFLASFKH